MKHGKNPTARQKKFMSKMGLNVELWLVERDTKENLILVHRWTGQPRIIPH